MFIRIVIERTIEEIVNGKDIEDVAEKAADLVISRLVGENDWEEPETISELSENALMLQKFEPVLESWSDYRKTSLNGFVAAAAIKNMGLEYTRLVLSRQAIQTSTTLAVDDA